MVSEQILETFFVFPDYTTARFENCFNVNVELIYISEK